MSDQLVHEVSALRQITRHWRTDVGMVSGARCWFSNPDVRNNIDGVLEMIYFHWGQQPAPSSGPSDHLLPKGRRIYCDH